HPAFMRVHRADLRARLGVPPDEPAVVAAGDEGVAGQGDAGDVAVVLAQFLRLRLGGGEVDLVDLEVGAAGEEARAVRHPRQAEPGGANRVRLRRLELVQLPHGFTSSLAQASTSLPGLVPGSVTGPGRQP